MPALIEIHCGQCRHASLFPPAVALVMWAKGISKMGSEIHLLLASPAVAILLGFPYLFYFSFFFFLVTNDMRNYCTWAQFFPQTSMVLIGFLCLCWHL